MKVQKSVTAVGVLRSTPYGGVQDDGQAACAAGAEALDALPEGPQDLEDAVPTLDIPLLEGYVTDVAARLGLAGWDIAVRFAPELDDASAQVEAPPYQRRASVSFGPAFLKEDACGMRDTVVHELVHLILMGSWKFVDELLDQEMSARTARVAWLGFVSHMEGHVDHLAGLLGPSVPLPPPGMCRTGGTRDVASA